jgi:23S rRNA (guanine2445-N2)-methyltransferase / 23S rRNA (guanine2069-N7)-methyltransferase
VPTLPCFFVSCPRYLEGLLKEEVLALSRDEQTTIAVSETQGGVAFCGPLSLAYRVCLWSRLASRVLLKLTDGVPQDARELYRMARDVPWGNHFASKNTFAVDNHVHHRAFGNPGFAGLTVKDAIVDSFRESEGRRPSVDTTAPDIRVFVYLTNREGALYLDLSGDSLHKRGYRKSRTEAPLRENTAAAVLHRAGWPAALSAWRDGDQLPFLGDPMCGSGTLPIEAALMATDAAPGLSRESFGFGAWKRGDNTLWQGLLKEAHRRFAEGRENWQSAGGRLWASDQDPTAIEAARENAERAGVAWTIDFGVTDLRRLTRGALLGRLNKQFDETANPPYFLVTNPPYGIRLSSGEKPEELYSELGKWMNATLPGCRAAVLAESREQAQSLGLRAERVNVFYNGNLKVNLAVLLLGEGNRFLEPQGPTEEIETIRNRLGKNMKGLRGYLEENDVSSFRLYDADIPQYAGAVDVYEDTKGVRWAVLQEYAPPKSVNPKAASERLADLETAVREFLEVPESHLITKRRRRQRGSDQYGVQEGPRHRKIVAPEDDLLFEVNLTDYIDTGLFLDGRILRSIIAEEAAGGRFLNLFSYTCTASVYAAAEGAETTSVDTSHTYLDWGERNFALNRIDTRGHEFVRKDCLDYLGSPGEKFDVILIDPPTFSNSKGREQDFDVQRDHEKLIRGAFAALRPGGSVFFSTNFRSFSLSEAVLGEFGTEDISDTVLPPDFKRRRRFRSTWKLTRDGPIPRTRRR